jgi:lipopolysaccharide/colanic/teichoic acid biosynthesis glycosyltransferase
MASNTLRSSREETDPDVIDDEAQTPGGGARRQNLDGMAIGALTFVDRSSNELIVRVDRGRSVQSPSLPAKKRIFDLLFTLLTLPIWGLAVLLVAALNVTFNGLPIFYVSLRRVFGKRSYRLVKFRTMIRGADRIANRRTIPCDGQRFLNIDYDAEIYTPFGRWIERHFLTELPQFIHVLSGRMSVVGNRPLPDDVVAALLEVHPDAEDRFAVPCGLLGPVQLVGRERLSDERRLRLEILYCQICQSDYRFGLDFLLILDVVLVLLGFRRQRTSQDVEDWLRSWLTSTGDHAEVGTTDPVVLAARRSRIDS